MSTMMTEAVALLKYFINQLDYEFSEAVDLTLLRFPEISRVELVNTYNLDRD